MTNETKLSNLKIIMLSFLKANNGMTGYDLTKALCAIGWSVSHQQIYRELRQCDELGLVAFTVNPQDGRPDSKIFGLTSVGVLVANSLSETNKVVPAELNTRSESIAYLLAGNVSYFKQLMHNLRIEIKRLLDKRAQIMKQLANCTDSLQQHDLFSSRLILERHINLLRTEVEFCGESATYLEDAM